MKGDPDFEVCREAIQTGSLSFHAASKLLPARVRNPALVLYAFCRLADDMVDEGADPVAAVLELQDRLERAYAGRPVDAPVDRAFARMVEAHQLPQALPEALIEGFAWDAEGRRYDTLSGVLDYSARVAAAVGAMMAYLMGVRDAHRLARACDLGLAMQLTNIARDVGEDAANGRIYLPLDWIKERGYRPEGFLRNPERALPDIRLMVRRLLGEASKLYMRSEPGIAGLPLDCRPGIFAARYIYAGIGSSLRKLNHNSLHHRARTTGKAKLAWLGLSTLRSGLSSLNLTQATLYAPPRPEVAFLVDAAATHQGASGPSEALLDVLAQLRVQDAARRANHPALDMRGQGLT